MTTKIQKLSLAFTPEHAAAMRDAIEEGEYSTQSEVVRDAMRLWTELRKRRKNASVYVDRLVAEGIASGSAGEVTAEDIKRAGRAALAAARKRGEGE